MSETVDETGFLTSAFSETSCGSLKKTTCASKPEPVPRAPVVPPQKVRPDPPGTHPTVPPNRNEGTTVEPKRVCFSFASKRPPLPPSGQSLLRNPEEAYQQVVEGFEDRQCTSEIALLVYLEPE